MLFLKLFIGGKLHRFFFETWHIWSQVLIKQAEASVSASTKIVAEIICIIL